MCTAAAVNSDTVGVRFCGREQGRVVVWGFVLCAGLRIWQAAAERLDHMFTPTAVICVVISSILAQQAPVVTGYANTYSGLVAGGHVIPLEIELYFTDNDHPDRTLYNHGMQCRVDDSNCQKPIFKKDSSSVLIVGFRQPTGNLTTVLQTYKGNELGQPTAITMKMCYSEESTRDRKWRKANDKISKDKRCFKNIAEDEDLAKFSGYSFINYTVPCDTPKAKFFVTAFLKCPFKNSPSKTQICGLDTTGGLDALVTEDAIMQKLGITGTKDIVDTRMQSAASKIIYIRTMSSHQQPPLLVGGVIGFSIFSVALLVFFLVYEHLLKKKK